MKMPTHEKVMFTAVVILALSFSAFVLVAAYKLWTL
jgi:hypothetical protein